MNIAIVADAGPLIALGRIAILQHALREILAPRTVIAECVADPERPDVRAIKEPIRARRPIQIADPQPPAPPFPVLGSGESAAIRLALNLGLRVLIDGPLGRQVATSLELMVVGSSAALPAAERRAIIDALEPMLDVLAASGYHSEAVHNAILSRAGEH